MLGLSSKARKPHHDSDKTQTNKPEWRPIFLKLFLKQPVFLDHIFETKTLPRFPLVLSDRADIVWVSSGYHYLHSIFRPHAFRYWFLPYVYLTIIPWARVGYEMVNSLISSKREWNNCFIKFLKFQKFEVRNPSEIEKIMMKMRRCVTPCGQTDVDSSQKTFLAFSRTVLLNVGIDPNFPQNSFFFLFWLYSEKNFAFRRKHF